MAESGGLIPLPLPSAPLLLPRPPFSSLLPASSLFFSMERTAVRGLEPPLPHPLPPSLSTYVHRVSVRVRFEHLRCTVYF
jgi:hypothetical protein